MQLDRPSSSAGIRARLGAAACLVLAAGAPALAGADAEPASPRWQFDGTGLLYGEAQRAQVVEPVARITRLFNDGQTLSAQLGIDVITGASPTGAVPSGTVQTITTPSGNVRTLSADQIPTSRFKDIRGSLDLEWVRPLGLLTATTGTHVSREKDYQSLGANTKLSLDLMHKLTTVTVGGGINHDGVFPVGGTPAGLSDGTIVSENSNSKQVVTAVAGVSRVLTRRWMMGVTASHTYEQGYLTEPYKVVSLLDGDTGFTSGQLTEKRPSTRSRSDILASSVYHFDNDVLYLSYRNYWDDWGVRSHTIDAKYRRELLNKNWLQPHVRLYTQTAANFFTYGLVDGTPLPRYASSDLRLGKLNTVTLGGTYGFHIPDHPGELTIRAEYIRQWGDGFPAGAIGAQRRFDLSPPLSIGSLLFGYSVNF